MNKRRRVAPLPAALAARLPVLSESRGQASLAAREIGIFGEIGWDVTARDVREALRAAGDGDVLVRINSPGGIVFEGFAIFNALARHAGEVTVIVEAVAGSMASLIAMAGDRIVMHENSFLFVHNPWGVTAGDAEAHREAAALLDKLREPMVRAYATRSGQDEQTVTAWMDADTWFSADEAVKAGLADEIDAATAAAPRGDLSRLPNVPGALVALGTAREPRPTRADDEGTQQRAEPAQQEQNMVKIDPAGSAPVSTEPAAQPHANAPAQGAAPVRPLAATVADIKTLALRAGLDASWVLAQIEAGATLDDARDAAINALAARQPEPVVRATVVRDEVDTVREGVTEALIARGSGATPSDRARPYMHHSILQALGEYVRAQGHTINIAAPAATLYTRLMEIRGMSSSDFPNILSTAANKMMMAAYQQAPATYRIIGARKTFSDFKPHNFLRLGDFPVPLEKTESAEFQVGAISEANSPVTLGTFGRIINLTRRALVNDDLSAFADLPARAGRRIADFENATFWNLLSLNSGAGPTIYEKNMPTGRPLFHAADHQNYTTPGGGIDVTTVGVGRAAMRKQTSLDGLKLNIAPRYLVTSPDRETVAQQFCSSIIVPSTDSAANPFKGLLTPVSDANLTGNAWYLFAEPADVETLVYGYLRGAEGPQVATRDGFTTDGMDMRVYIDFAVGGVDYRGAYKNAG